MVDPATSETHIQDAVARADRARRVRDTAGRLWTAAPVTAAACLILAGAGSRLGWAPLVTLFVLAGAALALGAYAAIARRRRAVSDADVSHIDADAGLQGELRSAHWFASAQAGLSAEASAKAEDDWIRFHIARAAERVAGIDWAALYPAPAAGRAKLATGVMAAAAIALAILVPGRAGVAASSPAAAKAAAAKKPAVLVALPPDLRKQLEEMLIKAESAVAGRPLTADEVRALLAKLDELARDPAKQAAANAPGDRPDSKADLKALAERAKKASESTDLEPEVRDELSNLANKLDGSEQDENAMASRDPQDAAAEKDASGDAKQSKSGGGKQDSASVQSVKEAAGGSGVGIVMMATDDDSSSREGGLGLGGGSSDRKNDGQFVDLGAALRKETVEASADNAGENVDTAERRKTEQSSAATAFSRTAVQPAERGSSTAPPPVPESRRAAVKSYFIRKQ
jgi:hypothetical protein